MQELFTVITTAMRRETAPRYLQLAPAALDVDTSTISLDVDTHLGGRKIFEVVQSEQDGCPKTVVRWRHEPRSNVSGTLGDLLGGTPEMVGAAAVGLICRHVGTDTAA